jgi:hypothetical protein
LFAKDALTGDYFGTSTSIYIIDALIGARDDDVQGTDSGM